MSVPKSEIWPIPSNLREARIGFEPVLLLVSSRQGAPDWEGLQARRRYPGQTPVQVDLIREDFVCRMQFGPDHAVTPGPEFWSDFEEWRQAAG